MHSAVLAESLRERIENQMNVIQDERSKVAKSTSKFE